jgi:hypothetical protein
LVTAWAVAKEVLLAFSHKFSPKKLTQHQLFACLVLKMFLKIDYRGLAAHLNDCPSWREAIELAKVPHFTTFQKAARRLLRSKHVGRLLDDTVHRTMGRKRKIPLAAIDSTCMESHHASRYFIRRDLMLMVLTHNIMILLFALAFLQSSGRLFFAEGAPPFLRPTE